MDERTTTTIIIAISVIAVTILLLTLHWFGTFPPPWLKRKYRVVFKDNEYHLQQKHLFNWFGPDISDYERSDGELNYFYKQRGGNRFSTLEAATKHVIKRQARDARYLATYLKEKANYKKPAVVWKSKDQL